MNETIYYLWDYVLEEVELLKENMKTFTVHISPPFGEPYTRLIPKEKCARPNEKVCIVWETWKGRNGRGAYRIERTLYADRRVPANQVSHTPSGGVGHVTESSYGEINE